jgi:serine/threonine-protein kinase
MSKILGIAVSNDPSASGGGSALAMNSSSYGKSDHSGQVKPRSCVGVAFTGEHDVYGGGDSAEIKTQTFGNLYRNSSTSGPYLLQQTAVVFPSAEQAQGFLTSSQSQWDSCTKTEVDVVLGYENGRGYTLGDVQRRGDLLTVSMASNGALSGAEGCQQVLGVRENVVVETRSCNGVGESANTNYDLAKQRWPSDPSWAANYAERVATAMLNNVTT